MYVPRRRRNVSAWIRNWLATTYPGETHLSLNQVRDEMFMDLPFSFVPQSVYRQWFDKSVRDAVRNTHWALTTGGPYKQLEFLFDMPLGDVIDYEIGKARRAKADLDAIREDLVAYKERTGAAFSIDGAMQFIVQTAGM